jgi:hypothetical protein
MGNTTSTVVTQISASVTILSRRPSLSILIGWLSVVGCASTWCFEIGKAVVKRRLWRIQSLVRGDGFSCHCTGRAGRSRAAKPARFRSPARGRLAARLWRRGQSAGQARRRRRSWPRRRSPLPPSTPVAGFARPCPTVHTIVVCWGTDGTIGPSAWSGPGWTRNAIFLRSDIPCWAHCIVCLRGRSRGGEYFLLAPSPEFVATFLNELPIPIMSSRRTE